MDCNPSAGNPSRSPSRSPRIRVDIRVHLQPCARRAAPRPDGRLPRSAAHFARGAHGGWGAARTGAGPDLVEIEIRRFVGVLSGLRRSFVGSFANPSRSRPQSRPRRQCRLPRWRHRTGGPAARQHGCDTAATLGRRCGPRPALRRLSAGAATLSRHCCAQPALRRLSAGAAAIKCRRCGDPRPALRRSAGAAATLRWRCSDAPALRTISAGFAALSRHCGDPRLAPLGSALEGRPSTLDGPPSSGALYEPRSPGRPPALRCHGVFADGKASAVLTDGTPRPSVWRRCASRARRTGIFGVDSEGDPDVVRSPASHDPMPRPPGPAGEAPVRLGRRARGAARAAHPSPARAGSSAPSRPPAPGAQCGPVEDETRTARGGRRTCDCRFTRWRWPQNLIGAAVGRGGWPAAANLKSRSDS